MRSDAEGQGLAIIYCRKSEITLSLADETIHPFHARSRGVANSTALSRGKGARKKVLRKISCNPLISLIRTRESKEIQTFPMPKTELLAKETGRSKKTQIGSTTAGPAVEKEPNPIHPNARRSCARSPDAPVDVPIREAPAGGPRPTASVIGRARVSRFWRPIRPVGWGRRWLPGPAGPA